MLTRFRAFLFLALLASPVARADENSIKAEFQQRFPDSPQVQSVTQTPLPGIYEVVVGTQIFYTDQNINYIFQGSLIDAKAHRNITEGLLQKITGIPFEKLPLKLAIKIVKGNGKRKLAIFEDPDCPYCKQLEQQGLSKVDNVTLYVFLYPIAQLHPEATEKSKKIWCSRDRAKAWTDAVLKDIQPTASATCNNPIDSLQKFAGEYRINATPTLIFADGRRVAGALPAPEIERLLDAAR